MGKQYQKRVKKNKVKYEQLFERNNNRENIL